ncbi:putative capsid protein [Bat faeces associated cyclovirus 4]|uniref:Putative capsid protein n=1 Tax=Bat faeces associated cyclovirus 4 TaxID=2050587 RepID=G1D7G9_9CIRC|nr:putative capsid protein [Bat faeces associated cyclovirus 4]AEL87793.1 putative capsid protein [Bat faeces associated cyclovirus 4]
MARFRRRVARRRPVRSIRRIRRRRRYGRRRSKFGCMMTKLTRLQTFQADATKNTLQELHIQLAGFPEYLDVAQNFEFAKFVKVVTRIYPHQNVGNNSSSALGNYILFPYHKFIPARTSASDYLSIDKAKMYPSWRSAILRSVPSILTVTYANTGDTTRSDNIVYRPKIPWWDTEHAKNLPTIYLGGMLYQGLSTAPAGSKATFTIKQDIYVKFFNQNTINDV